MALTPSRSLRSVMENDEPGAMVPLRTDRRTHAVTRSTAESPGDPLIRDRSTISASGSVGSASAFPADSAFIRSSEDLGGGVLGDVVLDSELVVGAAPDLVAVLPADLPVAALEGVHQPEADPGARLVRAVPEAVAGDGELEDAVVEHPLLGGEPVQVGDLVNVHRPEDPQVLLLDRLPVAVDQAPGRYLPHDVVGVHADREVD